MLSVVDDEVGGLILLMTRAGVVEVGELVKGEFAVSLGPSGELLAIVGVAHDIPELEHAFVAGMAG